jgi:hypothetical protein
MGGTCAVREEPGKQKLRSAFYASRMRGRGRRNWPEAVPKKMGGRKRGYLTDISENRQRDQTSGANQCEGREEPSGWRSKASGRISLVMMAA